MKKLLWMLAVTALFTSCDDDEIIEVKDYGMKSIEADLGYDSSSEVSYTKQVYIKLGGEATVAEGEYGTDSWTNFNFCKGVEGEKYNVDTDVTGWDIVFTNYRLNLGTETEPYPYAVTGALVHSDCSVAFAEYVTSDAEDAIAAAFAALTLADITDVEYSSDMDAIGYNWKSFDMNSMLYAVSSNYFFFIKLSNGDIYKLRFTSFYGDTTNDRVVNAEYALMQ
nr:HmuY family protein [uncultured Carboxylicivirga sp.]